MTAVTSLTEQVARELHIHDDWRIKQIDPGQLVQIWGIATFKKGAHIYTKTHSDVGHQTDADMRDSRILRVSADGGANELDRSQVNIKAGGRTPAAYRPVGFVIVYNRHYPTDPLVSSWNTFVWLYVSPAVNLGRLKKFYKDSFRS